MNKLNIVWKFCRQSKSCISNKIPSFYQNLCS